MSGKKILSIVSLVLFYGLLIFLTFNKHSKSGYFNFESEIWADRAGYFVYLPAVFHYGFEAQNFPDSIDIKTGKGFLLNRETDKVETKYTYAVALMQAPFYLLLDLFHNPEDGDRGFSPAHHASVNLAGVTYLFFGLIFLFKFLRFYFSSRVSFITVFCVAFATHLYYYGIDETGMSHVYSFFLFAAWFLLLKKSDFLQKGKLPTFLLFGFISGLIFLARPTSALFLTLFFLWDTNGVKSILQRVSFLKQPRVLLPVLLAFALVLIPQLAYWKFTYGSFLQYTYGNERFIWSRPEFFSLWFSPNNGLFLYVPFFMVMIVALLYSSLKKQLNGILSSILFLGISYVFSCWWIWAFGCSFGSRNFVEYTVVFAWPLAFLFQRVFEKSLMQKIGLLIVVALFTFFNFTMIYAWKGCYFGDGHWDWAYYFDLIERAILMK